MGNKIVEDYVSILLEEMYGEGWLFTYFSYVYFIFQYLLILIYFRIYIDKIYEKWSERQKPKYDKSAKLTVL